MNIELLGNVRAQHARPGGMVSGKLLFSGGDNCVSRDAEVLVEFLGRPEAPKDFMPMKVPVEPMIASQPWRMPASTAIFTGAWPMIASW